MSELPLKEQLALAEFLATYFTSMRAELLNPQALDEMVTGERLAVRFAGILAAWVSLPKAAETASVKNKAAFLAWMKEHMPHGVETVEQVRPGTQAQLLREAKANGGKWISPDGEAFEIDGVEFGTRKQTPHVELTGDAAAAVSAGVRAGDINFGQLLLALPAGKGDDDERL